MTALTSFEDIIYIIIGLLWIIFSFYNAKKKKKEKNASAPKSEKKSILESLINEIGLQDEKSERSFYESPQDIDQVEPKSVPILTEDTDKIFSYDDDYEESNYNSTVDVIEKKPLVPITEIDEAYNTDNISSVNKKIKKNIDLRKAVIYSEILKKVYF